MLKVTRPTYFNASIVADFDILDERSSCNDNTSTLVSIDEREFGGLKVKISESALPNKVKTWSWKNIS